MGAIEDTGRQTLAEMRRILGVLRHEYDRGELEPQPGVDQIYALIQRAREQGQPIELSVDGDPGTLPAGIDLGLYRILEEALHSAARQPAGAVEVALRFGEDDLELRLAARCAQTERLAHGRDARARRAVRRRAERRGSRRRRLAVRRPDAARSCRERSRDRPRPDRRRPAADPRRHFG